MITVVGMGPGHPRYLTSAAIDAIRQAGQVIAFGRIAAAAETITPPVQRVNRVDEVLAILSQTEDDTAILASGDPCFYGILEYLKKQGITVDTVIPGLSSFQYLMAKLGKSWHTAAFVSLHGREADLTPILGQPLTVILTDRRSPPSLISQRLHALGVAGTLYVGYNLSYDEELILTQRVGDDFADNAGVAVVVVEQTENALDSGR
jgi:cobalt-precorrin-7 (C5)-methyltransferase